MAPFLIIPLILGCLSIDQAYAASAARDKMPSNQQSHYYRDQFMKEKQGQSCSDLKARKSRKNKDILFCKVPAPDYGVSTTVSFWGWDNGGGKKTGIITVNATFSSGKTMQLKEFRVGEKVNWYHFDFTLTDEAVNELKLYYNTGNRIKNIKLNLRDVWIRSTSEDAGKRPSEFCSQPMYIIGIILTILTCVSYLILRICVSPRKVCPMFKHRMVALDWMGLFTIVGFIGFIMFTEFFRSYPGSRCKNDGEFDAAIIMISISLIPYLIIIYPYILNLRYYFTKEAFQSCIIEMIVPSEPIETTSDIIQIATQNFLEKEPRFYTPGKECTMCLLKYATNGRPPIASQCGHIFCPGCTLNNCTVGKCPRCCFWTKIRPNKLMLVKIDQEDGGGLELGTRVSPLSR